GGQRAHEPRELRCRVEHRGRAPASLGLASQVPQRVSHRVPDLDRAMELPDAVDREALLERQPRDALELAGAGEAAVGRVLELRAQLRRGCRQVLLPCVDLLEHARHESVADVAGAPHRLELRRVRAPHRPQGVRAEHGHADDRAAEQREAPQNANADRVEWPHWLPSVTSRPLRTTPMTTLFDGTFPVVSKAILPVTPSKAATPRPTSAR